MKEFLIRFYHFALLFCLANGKTWKGYTEILLDNCHLAVDVNSPSELELESQNITIHFRPSRFVEIDDVRESLTVLGVLHAMWDVPCVAHLYADSHLKANSTWPSHADYVSNLNPVSFWKPPTALGNAIIDSETMEYHRIQLWMKNGHFQANAPRLFTSFCDLDFLHFPYDRQQCSFTFLIVEDIKIVKIVDANWRLPNNMDDFIPQNANWLLENHSISWEYFKPSPNLDFYFSSVTFTFQLQRQPDYYLLNLLMPSFLLALLELSSFLLTPSSTDRAAYAVTIMLSVMVVQNSFLSLLPNTPKPILVAYYAAGNTIFAAFCAIYSSFLCYFINNHPKKANVTFKITICGKKKTMKLFSVIDFIAFALSVLAMCFINIGAVILIQTLQ